MNQRDVKQFERKLRIMRIAPWGVLAAVSLVVVPHYLDANESTTRLAGQLLEAEELPGELASIEQLLKTENTRGERLTQAMISAEQVHAFHNRIVDIARTSGCKVRRITEGARTAKPWVAGQPVANTTGRSASAGSEAGGLRLETQDMNIQLTGTLAQIKRFLEGFKQTEAFIHTNAFSLSRPQGQDAKLDVSLLFLNLTRESSDETT